MDAIWLYVYLYVERVGDARYSEANCPVVVLLTFVPFAVFR